MHERALAMRELSLLSISSGISTKLLHVDYSSAAVRANEAKPPRPPENLKVGISGAEKLGRWFAKLPQGQVFSLLQIEP